MLMMSVRGRIQALCCTIGLLQVMVAPDNLMFAPYPFELNEYKQIVANDRTGFVKNLTESLSNQHLVMIGDSIMRQQYLSLAYLLRNKTYTDVNSHLDNGWYEHFIHTNEQLQPYEFCDCYRENGYNYDSYCENRFYSDPAHNISVTYLQFFGKDLFGHWFDEGDYDSFREPRKQPFKILWRLSIQDTITNMLSKFTHKVTLLMINFDHWEFSPHRKPFLWDNALSDVVYEASVAVLGRGNRVPEMVMHGKADSDQLSEPNHEHSRNKEDEKGHKREKKSKFNSHKIIWKTATQARSDFESSHNSTTLDERDNYMCSKEFVHCFNMKWTTQLPFESYIDHIHFKEDIADVINLQFLYDVLID